MSHAISRLAHAFTDYNYVAAVSIAPKVFGFADDPRASRAIRVFASAIAGATFLTRAEWGWLRVLPYKQHVQGDFAVGLAAFAAPWAFGFADNKRARDTFLVMGAVGVAVGLLSGVLGEPEEMPAGDDEPSLSGTHRPGLASRALEYATYGDER